MEITTHIQISVKTLGASDCILFLFHRMTTFLESAWKHSSPPMMPIFGTRVEMSPAFKTSLSSKQFEEIHCEHSSISQLYRFLSDAIIDRLSTPKEDKCRVMTGTQLKHYHPFAWPLSVLMSIMQISSELKLF